MSLFAKIVNAGVSDDASFRDNTRLKGMNYGSLIGAILSLCSIILALDCLPLVIYLASLVIILSLGVFFNYFHKISFARYFVIISIMIWLILASVSFGSVMGLENYFYVALVCLLLFEVSKRSRLITAGITVVALVAVKLYQKSHVPLFDPPSLSDMFYISDIIFPCLIIGLVCYSLLQDIQEYQNGILRRKQNLKEANLLRDKMLSIIGHDLKSPLHSLRATLLMLKDGTMTPTEQQMVVDELQSRLDQSTETLESLLDWASQNYFFSTGDIQYTRKMVDVYGLCEKVLEFYKVSAEKKKVTLINQLPEPLQVMADADQLMFVLRNLVGNAIKFSHYDGTGSVTISCEKDKSIVHIIVADNGVGMEYSVFDNLFNVERRQSGVGTQNEKGSGFGLIFCKEFIEKNEGHFHVESQSGKGSKFIFTLPTIS